MDVLVTYATKHGSTHQVAELITATLREQGARVELCPARAARAPVAGYDLVIVGGALYSGRWHHHAHRFLERHRTELAATTVALFAMGPRNDTEDAWHSSYAQFDRALAKHPWLHPAATVVFGGVDPPGHDHPRRDLRDRTAIRRWATLTAGQGPAGAAGGVAADRP